MPAGQEKPPWGVARPRGRMFVLYRIWANTQRDKLPHVIARVARPVAIRAPVLPPTSNPARGIRIATGINALAMTCGNIYGCVFTWGCGEYAMDAIGRDKTHPYKKTPVGIHRGVNRE